MRDAKGKKPQEDSGYIPPGFLNFTASRHSINRGESYVNTRLKPQPDFRTPTGRHPRPHIIRRGVMYAHNSLDKYQPLCQILWRCYPPEYCGWVGWQNPDRRLSRLNDSDVIQYADYHS